MSKQFVELKMNARSLDLACRQQEQINHFIKSSIQTDVTEAYITQWAERNYVTNDYFLTFVKSIFKTDNFLSFYKFLRYPLASSRLVNNRIKAPLRRVFYAEDSYFKYEIKGDKVKCPDELSYDQFNDIAFDALFFRYNDIVITDMRDEETPIRNIVSIKNVVSIESKHGIINRIAYTAMLGAVKGHLYIDSEAYIFYPTDKNIPTTITKHDLGRCPADYISSQAFDESDNDVVRHSIFSHVRTELEEYVFLKTLQKMTEPNGAIPVVTTFKTKIDGTNDDKGVLSEMEPNFLNAIGSQQSKFQKEIGANKGNNLQTGTQVKVDVHKKEDGSIDTDFAKNFFNFFYIPTEALEYLKKRIDELEESIILDTVGDYSETTEASKNELQVGKSYVSKQDKLREISKELSRLRTRTDYNMLALKYGPDSVETVSFYGSDFFLETDNDIYEMIKSSPNQIESKNLLMRLARNKNRFNPENLKREHILYQLLPYSTDADFKTAVDSKRIGDITFQYQIRFNYWIDLFEANYGDILYFWETLNSSDSEKMVLINNLIIDLIKSNYEQTSNNDGSPDGIQG